MLCNGDQSKAVIGGNFLGMVLEASNTAKYVYEEPYTSNVYLRSVRVVKSHNSKGAPTNATIKYKLTSGRVPTDRKF